MVGHEGGDEIIAVVVTALPAQGEGNTGLITSGLEQFGLKLLAQKRIGVAIVDQELRESGAVLDQGDSVMLAPGSLVLAEIVAERLDAPRHSRRSDNRCKRAS